MMMRDKDVITLESLYTSILNEAKDYRKIIVRQLGMPEDVAEYLHSIDLSKNSDSYSQWFATQIRKKEGYKQAEDKLAFVKTLKTDIESILDWFDTEKKVPIFDYTWDEALAKDYRKMLLKGGNDSAIIEYLHSISPGYYFLFANQIKKFKAYKEALDKMAWFESVFITNIPNNVRNYLLNTVGKNYLWFVIQIKKMEGYIESTDKLSWVETNLREDIANINDWLLNNQNENIWSCVDGEVEREGRTLKVSGFDRARGRANQYHLTLAATGDVNKWIDGPEKRTVLKTYPDGYYWITHNALSSPEESKLMGHCGSDSIYDPVTHKQAKDGTLISLRYLNPENNHITAHVTATISKELGSWVQCKGHHNQRPNKNYYPYIADILNDLKIYRFIYGSYKPELNFDDSNYIQTVLKYPEMFPNLDEIVPKIKASLRARNLKQMFASMASDFNQNIERQFIEFDDEDKEAYVMGGYTIGTKRAIDSLSPELKERYFQTILNSSDKSLQYIKTQLRSGVALKDIDQRFIASVKRDKYLLDDFISTLIQDSSDFEENPDIMNLIAESPSMSSVYLIKIIRDKKIPLGQIDMKYIDAMRKNGGFTFDSFIEELIKLKVDIQPVTSRGDVQQQFNDVSKLIYERICGNSKLSAEYVKFLIIDKKAKPENIDNYLIQAISKNQHKAAEMMNFIFGTNVDIGILPKKFYPLLDPIAAYKYVKYLLDIQDLVINQIDPELLLNLDKSAGKTYHLIEHLINKGQEKLYYKYQKIPISMRTLVGAVFGHIIENETDPSKKQDLQARFADLDRMSRPNTPNTRTTRSRNATPNESPTPEPQTTEDEEDDDEGFDIEF
jgi:hypothetical protein